MANNKGVKAEVPKEDILTEPTADEEMITVSKSQLEEMITAALAQAKAAEEGEEEAEAKAKAAEKKIRRANAKARAEEKVAFFVQYVDGQETEVTAGYNGTLYKIKKGEEVLLPRALYDILVQSDKQAVYAAKVRKSLEDQGSLGDF